MTITPEATEAVERAVEAAAAAMSLAFYGPGVVWEHMTEAARQRFRDDARTVLIAATPIIGAQTLREAANTIGGYIKDGADADASPQDTMKWLRARAQAIEELLP
jgi:hypothetical protein